MDRAKSAGSKGGKVKGGMGKKVTGFGSKLGKGKMGGAGMSGPCKS